MSKYTQLVHISAYHQLVKKRSKPRIEWRYIIRIFVLKAHADISPKNFWVQVDGKTLECGD